MKLITALACAALVLAPAAAGKDRRGAALYAANCASCHGLNGQGVPTPTPGANGIEGQGPPLRNVGALAADFYLRTGYMPLANAHDQPSRRHVVLTEAEIRALVGYVASLGHGPPIPTPHPGSVPAGQRLFTDHCAGCHQIVGEGGYVTDTRVPALRPASPTQIAEAVRIGPYLMPSFPRSAINGRQLNSIIAYLQASKQPNDRGGWGIGHIGPVPEGMVTWFIAALALVGLCVLIGERLRT